jgi:hypothetical protein
MGHGTGPVSGAHDPAYSNLRLRPPDYPRFLDYAANELGFLQKVGGGYTFMHRYLQEYFAQALSTEVPGPAGGAGNPACEPAFQRVLSPERRLPR